MAESGYIVVLVTSGSGEEARKIADRLLAEHKAACVSILTGVSSAFWWQGKVDSAEENLLVIKTKRSQLDDIVALVKKLHSNGVPEVIALPIIGGNQDYLDWLDKEVK